MARITKGKTKLCRRERVDLYPRLGEQGQTSKRLKKRGAPGEHPMYKRQSQYATQFREKQKVKRMYGLLERQFRKFYKKASKNKEATGLVLLQLLERRLDNVVYRSGLAKTRDQARQLVNHGHVTVNGSKLNIPSYIVAIGDVVELKDNISKLDWYKEIEKVNETYTAPAWLDKKSTNSAVITNLPTREEMDLSINEQNIVEFYSK